MDSLTPKKLRYRQIHLDFHTSPHLDGVGEKFDKAAWQDTLLAARVDSVTLFSKCHHGWSYHPTSVGKMHPHLKFDLLRAQFEACREVGIRAPIYLSAGVDNLASHEHPEWRQIDTDGSYEGWVKSPLQPGFHSMDFFSPYLDYLCRQIREATALFPDCDGIFLDIVSQRAVCSRWGLDYLREHGLDPANAQDRETASQAALMRYYRLTTEATIADRPDRPIVHNSGHLRRGNREVIKHFTHFELESLPTGGWGYDHFPMSAKYAVNLGLDFLGMTGKFHTTWGEFGGYKHLNALRYECAAMLAFNAKCSIGDQLHPSGVLDRATYENIGLAYAEVEAKEPWCVDAVPVADLGVLSSEAENTSGAAHSADEGAVRVLLESHFLFTIVDREMDFGPYKLLMLPDDIRIDQPLKEKLDAYYQGGGKLLLTGQSGLWKDREEFAFDIGATYHGPSEFSPDYLVSAAELRPDFVNAPLVMYLRSQRIRVTTGQSLGEIYDPYFNRALEHFCSHQHAPPRQEASGYDAGARQGNIVYLAHPVFSQYRGYGASAYREMIAKVLRSTLGSDLSLSGNLPASARVSVNYQALEKRHIVHLLYACPVSRGGEMKLSGGTVAVATTKIEVIEDLPPLHKVRLELRLPSEIARITLEPGGADLPFTQSGGRVSFEVAEFSCHQMVALHER